MVPIDVNEDREATIARFVNGLSHNIVNVVELEDTIHMTIKVERKLKIKSN